MTERELSKKVKSLLFRQRLSLSIEDLEAEIKSFLTFKEKGLWAVDRFLVSLNEQGDLCIRERSLVDPRQLTLKFKRESKEMTKNEIQEFERRYAALEETQGTEAAKAYFRESFAVACQHCGHVGKTVRPLNCARCGTYLD